MPDTSTQRKLGHRRHSGNGQPALVPQLPRPGRQRRGRRLRRILLATAACLVVLAGAADVAVLAVVEKKLLVAGGGCLPIARSPTSWAY